MIWIRDMGRDIDLEEDDATGSEEDATDLEEDSTDSED
jgi:hypothetical protein